MFNKEKKKNFQTPIITFWALILMSKVLWCLNAAICHYNISLLKDDEFLEKPIQNMKYFHKYIREQTLNWAHSRELQCNIRGTIKK